MTIDVVHPPPFPATLRAMSTRVFNYFTKRAQAVLAERWGESFAAAVIDDARRAYPAAEAQVPDIGGRRNAFTPVMVIISWLVALHEAMKNNGKTAADTISVMFEVSDRQLRGLPPWLLRTLGRLAFSAPSRRYFRNQAKRSQAREYSDDFVYHIEERADGEMSFVFSECAVNKHFDAQGLEDLKPYCNFFDVTYSRLMNMGVDARETIGTGCEKCALRFKHGRDTVVPMNLADVIPTE